MKEDALALAEDVESTIGGCYGCLLDKRGLCKADSDFDCNDEVCKFVAHRLRAIVVRDAKDDTTVSAYDLLPEDEREAIAWVREQGGLEAVKASAHQGAMEHGCLLKIAEMLETSIYDGSDKADALLDKLDKRLMPEGMEWLLDVWPRWSNGEYCKFGDWWMSDKYGESEPKQFSNLSIYTPERLREWGQDDGDHFGYEWDFVRPANPKYRPDKVEPAEPKVLAADGEPLEPGQTVWHKSGLACGVVETIDAGSLMHTTRYRGDDGTLYRDAAKDLVHKRPDSWERLEHDAEKTVCEYFGANYDCANCPLESARCAEEVKKDIIRRAKKLAERGA